MGTGAYGKGKAKRLQVNVELDPDDDTLINELAIAAAKRLGMGRVTRVQVIQLALRALARECELPGYPAEKG